MRSKPRVPPAARRRRRGSVYVLVLLAIIVCSVMLVSALDLVRSRHRFAGHTSDYFQANANAAAGLELALRDIESTPAWRWAPGDGAWYTDLAMPGGGAVSVKVSGSSSALSTDATTPALITSIGTHGSTRAIQQVSVGLLTEGGPPITGPSTGASGLLAWWPLDGAGPAWCDEAITGAAGSDEKFGAGTTYPGAFPSPGLTAAPWFWSGSSASLDSSASCNSVRTISFWFYADSTSSLQYLLERENLRITPGEWAFYLSGGEITAEYVGKVLLLVPVIASTSAPVTADRWHHVVLVAESSRIVLYIDGVGADSDSAPGSDYWNGSGLPDLRVSGQDGLLGTLLGPFTGSVCDVMILASPMSATDVAALHSAYRAPGEYRILADSFSRAVR
ncbi:MAG: LamG domain-containing protein [Phycisphaerales bacterium]|nr:LamG domain-containing protein [Phycisphaerales bacterium]